MLEYDWIDVSEGIDINKTNKSKECDICHYWYFLNRGLKMWTISLQWLSWFNPKKLWILMMLPMFLLEEVIIDFICGTRAKMIQ